MIAVVLYIRNKHKLEVDETLFNLKSGDRKNPCEKQCNLKRQSPWGLLGVVGTGGVLYNCRRCMQHNNLL